MKYFLTGATGFVGGVLAKQLRAAGHAVHASVRNLDKAAGLKQLGVTLFQGDVTDKESMRPAMLGVDGVFHVAGWYKIGVKDKSGGVAVNINGSRHVFELMRELQIPKGVYTSSLVVNSDTHGKLVDEAYRFTGTHLSEYDRTKAVAHDLANAFIAQGLPLTIVIPGVIYGPGDTSSLRGSLRDLLKGQLPMVPAQAAYCWAHVDDIAHGHVLAMERGKIGESYIIGGEPCTLVDAFQLASETAGVRAPGVAPAGLLKAMSVLVAPLDAWLPDAYTSEGLREIAGVTYLGDNAKAKRDLGYHPRPLREGWVATVKHEQKLL
jgi:nucleoside-diphosphate-sugar epimerase